METKLHIDLAQQTIHVEGTEEFVREIYKDFKDRMVKPLPIEAKKIINEQPPQKVTPTPQATKVKQTKKDTLVIISDLNLAGNDDKPSLKDFYSRYDVQSYWDKNLIFIYYLQNIAHIAPINTNHIYTCYRDVATKMPTAFKQSLRDTASNKGWIDASNWENIIVTTVGINYIEFDMAKTKAG
jgi:hypothetical protein